MRPGSTPPTEESTNWTDNGADPKVARRVPTPPTQARNLLIIAAIVAVIVVIAVAIAVGLNYAHDVSQNSGHAATPYATAPLHSEI